MIIPFTYMKPSSSIDNLLLTGLGSASDVTFNGVTVNRGILKMDSNGIPDTTFNSGGTGLITASMPIVCALTQSDGKIVCLLNNASPNAQYNSNGTNYSIGSGNGLFRLNSDGSFDTTFTKPTTLSYNGAGNNGNNGGNNTALAILDDDSIVVIATNNNTIQKFPANGATTASNTMTLNATATVIRKTTDNKIFVVGTFTTAEGVSANRMIRLNSDLTKDTSFVFSTALGNSAFACEVQSDGKIIIGGTYTTVNSASRSFINRQYEDGLASGTFDASYVPTITSTAYNTVYARMALQSDGKLLSLTDQLSGGVNYNGTGIGAGAMYRVNSDASLDTTFTRLTPNSRQLSMVQLNDGKILVAGLATTLGGVSVTNVYRLNSDGTRDNTFSMTGTSSWNRNLTLL